MTEVAKCHSGNAAKFPPPLPLPPPAKGERESDSRVGCYYRLLIPGQVADRDYDWRREEPRLDSSLLVF